MPWPTFPLNPPDEDPEPVVAAGDPSWFDDPSYGPDGNQDGRLVLQQPDRPEEAVAWGAPLEVSADGQISGHAALWGRCHVGYSGTCVRPPKEKSSYAGYLVGSAVDGVPTGPLVLATGHAELNASAAAARAWYDNTGTAVADVTVGSDDHGIWVAGATRTTASPEDVEVLRGSALSGDWRPIGGQLKLVGLLAVNSPGFRVNRPRAMAASGSIITVGPGCDECSGGPTLEERLAVVEQIVAEGLVASVHD